MDKIPDKNAWGYYKEDLDVEYFRRLAFGKSIDEIQCHFGEAQSISRSDELLFSPRAVFQYYVFAFANFLKSEKAKGDPDSASPFLSLLDAREKMDPGSVKEIFFRLSEIVEFVASHQQYFDADIDIYGDFQERAKLIRMACDA
jgi:hypothetical protein